MTPWKKVHRYRVCLKRSAWLLVAILGIGGLSAVTLSGDSAFTGAPKANFGQPVPGFDVGPDRSGGAISLGSGTVRGAMSFSSNRPVPLHDEDEIKVTEDEDVFVSGSLHGDPRRIPIVAGRIGPHF